MLAIDHSMVGSVPVKISGRCRAPSATSSGHAPAVPGESVCTPGHWRLVRGTEFITPRRRSYGKVCIQGGWSRFSG
jgi:hypothetical protein